ncbi:uncharacterized protein LOC132714939 [Ruditapes philippinarum]|uniref:uncharacterized protein LOC132714939 n=1 Tax=Ruditapes philippinarum TaxID=129788 RepID=UPI00295A9752|nr:uncharacterized protein LOC132714939 [Ruditapes philippinarum]
MASQGADGGQSKSLSQVIDEINKGQDFRVVSKTEYDKFIDFQKSSFSQSTPHLSSKPNVGRGRASLFANLADHTPDKTPHSLFSKPHSVSFPFQTVDELSVDDHYSDDNYNEGHIKKDSFNSTILGAHYIPKLPIFSGSEDVPKGEVKFDVWQFEVKCLISDSHTPQSLILQAIRNSLKGQARSMLVSVGEQATPSDIINKLDGFYGTVESGEDLMQLFYNDCQKPTETIVSFGVRLEETLSKAVQKGHIDNVAKDSMLRNKLWIGLYDKDLKRTTHHLYNNIKDFRSLLREIRKVEQQELASVTRSNSSSKPKVVQQQVGQVENQNDSNALVLKQLQELMNRMKTLETKMESSSASNQQQFRNNNFSGGYSRGRFYNYNQNRGRYNNSGQYRGQGRGYGRGFRNGSNRGSTNGQGITPDSSKDVKPQPDPLIVLTVDKKRKCL